MRKSYFVFILVMLIPMSSAFADNEDYCWFIFCLFDVTDKSSEKINTNSHKANRNGFKSNDNDKINELTIEEKYVKQQQKIKAKFIDQMKDEIAELKNSKKIITHGEENNIIPEMNTLHNGIDNRIDLLEGILETEEDMKNNPSKYLTQQNLVNRAMNYYTISPDGIPCDDDRRWVDDRNACIREDRANKIFYSWDLEWLRDYPEFDKKRDN